MMKDIDVKKIKGIRLETSADMSQKIGRLSIVLKGVRRVPFYDLNGFESSANLYFNAISGALSVNRVYLDVNYLLTQQDAVSKGYLDQWLLDNPLGGIDIQDVGTQKSFRIKV